jgi:hypothetical protein
MTGFLMRLLRLSGEFPGICGLSLVLKGGGITVQGGVFFGGMDTSRHGKEKKPAS